MVPASRPLKILHVFRAPLGGLFRHVFDLVNGQIDRGHHVGIIAESRSGGPHPEAMLAKLAERLQLGISRIPIGRHIGIGDIGALLHAGRRIRATGVDVVHGHGAKGGAYARLAARGHPAIRAYTPHGGSLLYRPGTLDSKFYVLLERMLLPRTDLFLFESGYIADLYRQKVGEPRCTVRIVRNGVGAKEFAEVEPAQDATDILFVGELRPIKAVDVLIDAIAALRRSGLALTATIVGGGPARPELEAQAHRSGLASAITFLPPMPAREAFRLGRLVVVPSRGESLPYIVLEVAAAGIPMVATNVGAIPNIFGAQAHLLVPPGDQTALAKAIGDAVKNPETMRTLAQWIRERVRTNFSVEAMVDGGIAGYRDALRERRQI